MAYGTDWNTPVKNLLKGEMRRRGIGYRESAERLDALGVDATVFGVSHRVSRGSFSAVFLVQCLHAIGTEELRLDVGQDKTGVPPSGELRWDLGRDQTGALQAGRPRSLRGGYRRASASQAAERSSEEPRQL